MKPSRRVAAFPRPPALEREPRRIIVTLGGVTIADTVDAWQVLETYHPPTYYLPPTSFLPGSVAPGTSRGSLCEWKGRAAYVTLIGGGRVETDAGWTYPDPTAPFVSIRDHIALYAGRMDACTVGGEIVTPQPGRFYGGWITNDLIGPFKGAPGTDGW